MTTVVEFCQFGSHGLNNRGDAYPWDHWMNGRQWGYCPSYYGKNNRNFRRLLREQATAWGLTVESRVHQLAYEDWIVFYFHR